VSKGDELMLRTWSDMPLILMQLALVASTELVEAFEPRPSAPGWQRRWHRTALRAAARRRVA
jgi:hypothetical protein